MDKLLDVVMNPPLDNWKDANREAFDQLFGSSGGRYPKRAKDEVILRAPKGNIPFSAYIAPSNPSSGPYGGMSFVIFPPDEEEAGSCLVSFVVGTQGLSPDENILSRPGHARKVQAITKWLNEDSRENSIVAWSKHDPVRIERAIPDTIQREFNRFYNSFDKYNRVIYGMFDPKGNREITEECLKAFLDLYMQERGFEPLSGSQDESEKIRNEWMGRLFPVVKDKNVVQLLQEQRFVILQGPPGTGKTRMAEKLLDEEYNNNGFSIQFHPNTTYESFIGGLSPETVESELGFQFKPKEGALLRAIHQARENSNQPFLLHIDEVNRADLARVLGEAIYLFETKPERPRTLELQYDFPELNGREITIPENLQVLGTMNTADESIASLDVAIRRRFSFVDIWPSMSVVEEKGSERMIEAFRELLDIFIEYAPENNLNLLPGHSYFLEDNSEKALRELRVRVKPLLEDYLQQGFVSGFEEPVRAYLQWIEGLQGTSE